MTTARTFSTTIPAISFERVTGGTRVRRDGKGDTLFVTRDDRARSFNTFLVIMHGQGVVGRVAMKDGDWFTETGIYRNWDGPHRGAWQVFPSSTVRTDWGAESTDFGYATFEDAVAEMALYWLS